MLLKNKNAVIYGAGGAIGSKVARALGRKGAKVFLTGHNMKPLAALAKEIKATGGVAQVAQVDALDEQAVEQHATEVARETGHIDISFNLISIPNIQGTPLIDLSVEDFALPVMNFARTHFLTARAAARHTVKKRSGVILMMTTTPDRMAIPFVGAFGVACAAIEAFSHTLAAEIGPQGVRVVCLRSTGSPEAAGVHQSFAKHAKAAGITLKQWQANYERQTHLRRLTTLTEVANMAVFVASDWASAVTGTAMNLTCGAIVD